MTTSLMPVLFIGHGSPMNIINENKYTQALRQLGTTLPRPDMILVISAHWLTHGTFISSSQQPKQIYDFYGFPEELYRINYLPPGSPTHAALITEQLSTFRVRSDETRGFDHASWAVLIHMYPKADIPVVEMSLDVTMSPETHYELAKHLAFLREQNVLILGSGNIVHNLHRIEYDEHAAPYLWAQVFDEDVRDALLRRDHQTLIHYQEHPMGNQAVPTNDHYLPMLYSIALQKSEEQIEFIHESIDHGSISMRCFLIH
jgi:4,5-DOPA dioxygenase extradiol